MVVTAGCGERVHLVVSTWPPHERSLSLERSLCHGGAREVRAVSEDRNLCECGCINYNSGLNISFISRLVSGGSPPQLYLLRCAVVGDPSLPAVDQTHEHRAAYAALFDSHYLPNNTIVVRGPNGPCKHQHTRLLLQGPRGQP
jgi:hypothetical protein